MEENRIPKRLLCMNLETTRPRGRPRNRWQDEVREDGSIVGGEEWQEKVYDREKWKKLLRTARNHHILHMPMEWMNVFWDVTPCHLIEVLHWLEEHSATVLKISESYSVTSISSCNITQHYHSENNVLYWPVFLYLYSITKRFCFDKWACLGILWNKRTTHLHSNSHIHTYLYMTVLCM